MVTPTHLKKSDKIGILAPARKVSRIDIEFSIEKFHSWGLEVELAKNIFTEYNQFAGVDKDRQEDFQKMLDDASVKAIVCARGGYGSIRIIDDLSFLNFKKSPKWIVGYSDVTVMHSHINQNFGVETLHATMPINFNKDEESVEALRKVLFGEKIEYLVAAHPLSRIGEATAELVGGNLSMLYALQGSVSDIQTSGKILFIEDIDEYLYHIDRMMVSLKRSGKLSQLAGLVVGGLSDMRDNETPFGKTAEEIVLDAVSEYNYPVCFGFPAGHTTKNLALPLGRRAKLKVSSQTSLTF